MRFGYPLSLRERIIPIKTNYVVLLNYWKYAFRLILLSLREESLGAAFGASS